MCPFPAFSLFTNDCVSRHSSEKLVKFAENTALEGTATTWDEAESRHGVTGWCRRVTITTKIASQTRQMIVDFRKKKTPIVPICSNGEPTERLNSFKFLGNIISSDLGWENKTDAVVKKAQQRLFFLKRFGLRWKNQQRQRSRLNRVMKTASKIVGSALTSLTAIYNDRSKKSWQYYLRPNSPCSSSVQISVI